MSDMENYRERAERIKQAAHYDSVWSFGNVHTAFFHGAQWADAHPLSPWIKCSQRLPPFGTVALVRMELPRNAVMKVRELRIGKFVRGILDKGEWVFHVPGMASWLHQYQIHGSPGEVEEWLPLEER